MQHVHQEMHGGEENYIRLAWLTEWIAFNQIVKLQYKIVFLLQQNQEKQTEERKNANDLDRLIRRVYELCVSSRF